MCIRDRRVRVEKVALITGITGQDGSYLAELLLGKGYEVHGLIRRASTFNTQRIDHLYTDPHEGGRLHLHYGDLSDGSRLTTLVASIAPVEVYNLAAQSHVRVSFDEPEYTGDTTWDERMRLDLYYVENWSLSLDIAILLRTLAAVVRGSGAY